MVNMKRASDAAHGIVRGRPPLPPDVARRIRVVTFVTAREKAMLDDLADSRSTSLSGICHELNSLPRR